MSIKSHVTLRNGEFTVKSNDDGSYYLFTTQIGDSINNQPKEFAKQQAMDYRIHVSFKTWKRARKKIKEENLDNKYLMICQCEPQSIYVKKDGKFIINLNCLKIDVSPDPKLIKQEKTIVKKEVESNNKKVIQGNLLHNKTKFKTKKVNNSAENQIVNKSTQKKSVNNIKKIDVNSLVKIPDFDTMFDDEKYKNDFIDEKISNDISKVNENNEDKDIKIKEIKKVEIERIRLVNGFIKAFDQVDYEKKKQVAQENKKIDPIIVYKRKDEKNKRKIVYHLVKGLADYKVASDLGFDKVHVAVIDED